MTVVLGAVFVASLLGSLHCAGMCGGLVAFYAGGRNRTAHASRLGHLTYSTGRWAVYALLGAVAGVLGAAFDVAGSLAGVQRGAALAAGTLIFLWGLAGFLAALGVSVPRPPAPAWVARAVGRAVRAVAARSSALRGLAMGLASGLLPCGWLYAFVAAAAATGSPVWGALTMTAFWAGTLPVMLVLGVGIHSLATPVRRLIPVASAVLLMALGLLTVAGRAGMAAGSDAHSHGHGRRPPASVEDALRGTVAPGPTALGSGHDHP